MTARSLPPPPVPVAINWAMIGVLVAIAVQFAGAVAFGVRVEARTAELRETTQPLRDGDLVKIQTDVAWIRERLEREDAGR